MLKTHHKKTGIGLLWVSITLVFIASCDKDNTNDEDDFDRKVLLENISTNLIIPYYSDYFAKTNNLKLATDSFNTNPNLLNLSRLKKDFKEAFIAWQYVAAYEFGPAQEISLYANTNTFPSDTANINKNISTGAYNLATAANIASKGFPAIDFLVNGSAKSEEEVVALFKTSSLNNKYQEYLSDIVTEINSNAKLVLEQWAKDYKREFVNSIGNGVGSSLGRLVNQINYDWEFLKNFQIGIPLGKKTLGNALPDKVEAYYGGFSTELAKAHQKAIQNLYLGVGKDGVNRQGFDDYLLFLKANYNGQLLSDAIKAQFEKVENSLALVPEPLSKAVLDQKALVNNAYTEMQKQLVLLKTDLPSALGVLITYQDNDGD